MTKLRTSAENQARQHATHNGLIKGSTVKTNQSNKTSRPWAIRSAIAMFCFAILAISTSPSNAANSATVVCPFCSAVNVTFAEQIKSNDVVVVACLLELPPPINNPEAELPKAKFEITGVLKGKKFVKDGMEFRSLLVGRYPVGQKFLVMGVDPPNVSWSTPMKSTERVFKYIADIQELPASGPERLEFFQNYFEDEESVLAFDAYDEFAMADYKDLIALKPKMKHDQIMEWIKDPTTSVDRRRLYFTMLGVCGNEKDAEVLEEFIKSGNRKKQAGLDALIACYLALKGDDAVPLIEETFLKGQKSDYVDTLAAVSALRFHATELKVVSLDKIVSAIRHLLDRPKMADMIIPDLARWKDWTVMDRLVKMFKEADEDTNWLRVPVITYLRSCPKPEAKKYIEELSKIDPDAVKRADFFLNFTDDDSDEDDEEESEDEDSDDDSDEGIDEEVDEKDTEEKSDAGKTPATSDKKSGDLSAISMQPICGTEPQDRIVHYNGPNPRLIKSESFVARRVAYANDENDGGEDEADVADQSESANLPSTQPVDNTGADVLAPESGTEETFTKAPASMANETVMDEVARAIPVPAPIPAAAEPTYNLTSRVIFLPMLGSILIFLLMWCVLNGWFERLIF